MNVLITGATGFVGRHLVAHLAQAGAYTLYGTSWQPEGRAEDLPGVTLSPLDLRDQAAVLALLRDVQPGLIFHLAAQAFVPASFEDPWGTLENNIKGQLNLFQGVLALGLDCRILVVSSAEVYGDIHPEENPVTEQQPFRPANPYSVSKVAQDMLAYQYFLSQGLQTVRARAFNHIGPGQNTRFAVPNFAQQIAQAEAGQRPPVIRVGNLAPERDFTDVRDVVRAYHLIATRGEAGQVYNVCRGEAFSIRWLLDHLCALSRIKLRIEVEAERLRPVDVERVVGDAGRLRQDTGWQPTIDITTSLADILERARQTL